MKENILTLDVAEICGIIMGDGHISRYISYKRTDYRVEIVGDKVEEMEYFDYVRKLFRSALFKDLKLRQEKSYARLYVHSKYFVELFESFGMPVGKKSDKARIPSTILDNSELSLRFLKGLADTDFSISFKKGGRKNNSYPRIVGEFASKSLIDDVIIILNRAGITYYYFKRKIKNSFGNFIHHRIEINGLKNFNRWMECISFSNSKHLTKIQVWQILGYCTPLTKISERIKIIKDGQSPSL